MGTGKARYRSSSAWLRPFVQTPARLRWSLALLLVLLTTFLYDPSRWENTSGDTISTRYWPVAILKHHTWKLNPYSKDLKGVDFAALYFANGDWIPRVTWGMGPLTIPFYALADQTDLGGKEWTHDRISDVSRWNAILIAVWAVVAMFFLLVKFAPIPVAFASTLLFAFGTWNWSLGAQGLTSQGSAVLLHLLSLHLLWNLCTAPKKDLRILPVFGLGVLHAWLWSIRPNDILLVAPALFALRTQRLKFIYVATLAAFLAPVMYLYHVVYMNVFGFYGLLSALSFNGRSAAFWDTNFVDGFFGILFSPNRGAIVFFPLFLLTPYLWYKLMPPLRIREMLRDALRFRLPNWDGKPVNGIPVGFSNACFWGVIAYFISVFGLDYWHSTWSYGPRYYYDLQPFVWPVLTVALAEVWKWRKKSRLLPAWALTLLVIFHVQGLFVHALGHYNYDLYVWNSRNGPVDNAKCWRFSDFMLTEVWKVGSNKTRWNDALERLKKYGF